MLLRFFFENNEVVLLCTKDEYCKALDAIRKCNVCVPIKALFIEKYKRIEKLLFCSSFCNYAVAKDWTVTDSRRYIFLTQKVRAIEYVG